MNLCCCWVWCRVRHAPQLRRLGLLGSDRAVRRRPGTAPPCCTSHCTAVYVTLYSSAHCTAVHIVQQCSSAHEVNGLRPVDRMSACLHCTALVASRHLCQLQNFKRHRMSRSARIVDPAAHVHGCGTCMRIYIQADDKFKWLHARRRRYQLAAYTPRVMPGAILPRAVQPGAVLPGAVLLRPCPSRELSAQTNHHIACAAYPHAPLEALHDTAAVCTQPHTHITHMHN